MNPDAEEDLLEEFVSLESENDILKAKIVSLENELERARQELIDLHEKHVRLGYYAEEMQSKIDMVLADNLRAIRKYQTQTGENLGV